MRVEHAADLVEHLLLRIRGQHRDVAHRLEARDDLVAGEQLLVMEGGFDELRELRVLLERRVAPALVDPPRRTLLDPVHDRPQLVDEVVAAVPGVPDQSELTPGDEHAGELGQCDRRVEPVEALCHRDRIERPAGERKLLRGRGDAAARPGTWRRSRPHPRDRLDADERGAGRGQQPGELAGAGGDVRDARVRADAQVLGEPRDGFGRVARPRLLVDLGAGSNPAAATS